MNSFRTAVSAIVLLTSAVLMTTLLQPATVAAATVYKSPAIEFAKKKIKLGNRTISVEIADTDEKRERGLMFRESLADDTGMLFVFDAEQPLGFWMKNTLIPLNIGYFDANKKLIDIQEMTPAVMGEARPKTYPSKKPAMFALEMPKGWFHHRGIELGTKLSIDGK